MKFLAVVCFMFFSAVSFGANYVTVSIIPLKYFVEKIAGGTVEINVLFPAGSNPHIYEPKPKEMIKYSKSSIYFSLGDDFDKSWLRKLISLNSSIKIVHLDEGIEKITFDHDHENEHIEEKVEHKENHYDHGKTDQHIWTSISNIRIMGETIKNSLKEMFPENFSVYEANFEKFSDELKKLDKKIRGNISGKNFLVFHPSWGYFAKDYGIKQIPIEFEGKEPSPKQMIEIVELVKRENIKYLFTQPQINSKTVQVITKQTGLKSVMVDPLGYNILNEIEKIYEVISQ